MSTRPGPASRSLRCHAPGKINLGLRVVGRRADGYHELVSLFVPLDLGDEVEVAVSKSTALELEIKLEGASEAVPADATNLAYRAAKAFAEAADLNCRIELRIKKHLPAGAGLGGGSSDAGAVLRALCDLFPGALDGSRLAELALELGADVPFFLDPGPRWSPASASDSKPWTTCPRYPSSSQTRASRSRPPTSFKASRRSSPR